MLGMQRTGPKQVLHQLAFSGSLWAEVLRIFTSNISYPQLKGHTPSDRPSCDEVDGPRFVAPVLLCTGRSAANASENSFMDTGTAKEFNSTTATFQISLDDRLQSGSCVIALLVVCGGAHMTRQDSSSSSPEWRCGRILEVC